MVLKWSTRTELPPVPGAGRWKSQAWNNIFQSLHQLRGLFWPASVQGRSLMSGSNLQPAPKETKGEKKHLWAGHSLASPDRSLKSAWQFGKFKRWWTSPTRRMLRKPEACHTRELLAQATVSPPLSICLPTHPYSKAASWACVVLIVSINPQKGHGEMMFPTPPIYPPILNLCSCLLPLHSFPSMAW